MFRFSQEYFRTVREKRDNAENAIIAAQRAIENERRVNRRWRRRNPDRKPDELLALWDRIKKDASKDYSHMMVEFMALFDGVSEANKMMRHGLEATDTEIPLAAFHDMAFNIFSLRVFEKLADQTHLSVYTRELVLQRLVPQVFSPLPPSRKGFAAETVPLVSR